MSAPLDIPRGLNAATQVVGNVLGEALQKAVAVDASAIARENDVSLADIKSLVNISTALVADKVTMSFLYPDGSSPTTATGSDPTISFSIFGQNLSYTFLPNVSWQDIGDVGAIVGGTALAAAGAAVGVAATAPGVLLALYGTYDLLSRHSGDITGVSINGQNPAGAENTALPPLGYDNGEPEPDGDSDDGSFISAAIGSTNISGFSDYLTTAFPGAHLT